MFTSPQIRVLLTLNVDPIKQISHIIVLREHCWWEVKLSTKIVSLHVLESIISVDKNLLFNLISCLWLHREATAGCVVQSVNVQVSSPLNFSSKYVILLVGHLSTSTKSNVGFNQQSFYNVKIYRIITSLLKKI